MKTTLNVSYCLCNKYIPCLATENAFMLEPHTCLFPSHLSNSQTFVKKEKKHDKGTKAFSEESVGRYSPLSIAFSPLR